MCEVGGRLWQRGLVGATEGNLSLRLNDREILCTPSGVSKGHMSPDNLIIIDNDGKSLKGTNPSSEIKMHIGIYRQREDCQAIVHAHPPVATGFALANRPIPDDLLPEAMVVLGKVASIPFCMPGTDEVPDAMEPYLADHKTFLLCNHGAVALGKDILDAYHRMETLERIAQIILHANTLGGAKPIPQQAFEELKVWLTGKL